MKDIKLLYNMNMFVKNTIVQECLHNAMYNVNTVIGYKLAFFREHCNINLFENDQQLPNGEKIQLLSE